MPWIRQLHVKNCPGPECEGCGKWAATVRTPAGRRTKTHANRPVVARWAADLEVDARRGQFIDPRGAKRTVQDAWDRFYGAKHREKASRARDRSHWENHVKPRWGRVPWGAILKPDVSAWVVEMDEKQRVGPSTIAGALKVLRGLAEMAVDAKWIPTNPVTRVSRPPVPKSEYRVVRPHEERRQLARARELFGGRVDGELMVELMYDTGLRWEEVAALPPECVDTRRQRLVVRWVMERDGTVREYPKTPEGFREVPYGDQLAARLAAAKLAAPVIPGVYPVAKRGPAYPTRLVFHAAGGGAKKKHGEPGPLRYSNWLARVWNPSLYAAPAEPGVKVAGRPGPAPRPRGEPLMDSPRPTPHDTRHTYGTRLADNGVPQHEIMALMGHEDERASRRYLHAGEDRFDRARVAIDKAHGRSGTRPVVARA